MPSRAAVDGARRFAQLTQAEPRTIVVAGVGHGNECPVMRDLWPNARLIGVEPVEENRRRMERSQHWPGHPADLLPVALGREAGERDLFLNYEPDQRASFFDTVGVSLPDQDVRQVPVWTLDQLAAETGPWEPPVLLWLDAQGAELEIVQGASDETLRDVLWINAEVQLQPARELPTASEVDDYMRARGYRATWMHTLGKTGHYVDVIYLLQRDWIAQRRDYARRAVERKLDRKRKRRERRENRNRDTSEGAQ